MDKPKKNTPEWRKWRARQGGLATHRKIGSQGMSELGKRGMASRWGKKKDLSTDPIDSNE